MVKRDRVLFVVLLLLVSVMISGCQPPSGGSAATPAKATATKSVSGMGGIPTSSPEASPSPTMRPSPTPNPAAPPVPVAISPEPGSEISSGKPIVVTFSREIDPQTAGKAVKVEPAVDGKIAVKGKTLEFHPEGRLEPGRMYKFLISTDLKSKVGTSLTHPLYLVFRSKGPLRVSKVSPAPNSKSVDSNSPISIVFNKPIVPLTTLEESKNLPSPISVNPPIEGEGKWLNTSVYQFAPSEPMNAGTTYTVTVDTKLKDITGSSLAKPVSWSFTTQEPFVKEFLPSHNMVGPATVFTATFNVPMDEASVRKGVKLVEEETNTPVKGVLRVTENITVTFKPSAPLRMGSEYALVVGKGIKTLKGNGETKETQRRTWSVYPEPSVTYTQPEDGSKDFPPLSPIKVFMEGNIDPDSVNEKTVIISPKPRHVGIWYSYYDEAIFISFDKKAFTKYTITVTKDVKDEYGNTLGKDFTFSFTTGSYPPQATILRSNTVSFYSAYNKPPKLLLRYRNIVSVHLKLFRMRSGDPSVFLGDRSSLAKYGSLIREWDQKVAHPNSGEFYVDFIPLTLADGKELPNGFYYVEMNFGKEARQRDNMLFLVTPYNVVLKKSATEVLVWVTDLLTGKPVPHLPLKLYLSDTNSTELGQTDHLGVWTFKFKKPQHPWKAVAVTIHPDSPDGFVSSWNTTMHGWTFGFYGEYSIPDKHAVDIYTDRPIYRPGQTMYWKSIVRLDDDGRYLLPPVGTPVRVTIYDPYQNLVLTRSLKTNDMGTINGEFAIPDKAPLGDYSIKLVIGEEEFRHDFLVAEYRKPQFRTEITTDKTDYIEGETAKVKLHAEYFFGGPLSNAKVEWRVVAHDAPFSWHCPITMSCPDYQFEEPPWWMFEEGDTWDREIAGGTGITDSNGNLLLSLPTKIPKAKVAQRLTIEFDIQAPNGLFTASRTSVRVHKGSVYAGISVNSYVFKAGGQIGARFITVGYKGKVLPNQKFAFSVVKEEWVNVKKESNGAVYWTSEVKETPIITETLTSGEDGKATYNFQLKEPGDYKLVTTATDSFGGVTHSSTEIWVSGPGYTPWPRSNDHTIRIIPDKEEYRPGDLARIMIMSPYKTYTRALLTVERGGVLHTEVRTLRQNSAVITLRITDDYVPNVYVSVVVVQGGKDAEDKVGSAYIGYTELKVSDEKKLLKVSLKPGADKVEPRDTVTYTVEVRDSEGKPVDAELSVDVVDKAVLLLSKEGLHTLRETFYSERGLGIASTVSLFDQMEKFLIKMEKQEKEALSEKGGGGGGGGAAVRHYFPDNAYWNPTLRTGEDGKVTFSFKVPDNLTTWQVRVKAIDAKTRVGEAKSDLMVSKPFMVKPATTRFLTVGDEPTISAVLYNHTDKKISGSIVLETSGANISGSAQKTFTLEPGKNLKLDWKLVNVNGVMDKKSGKRVVSFLWKGRTDSGLRDDVNIVIPVYNYSTPETVATSGVVGPDSKVMESIVLPNRNLDKSQGELDLSIEPSLAASMNDGLRYLRHYPYECIEQKVSRFLPNIFTFRALKENGVENDELWQQLGKSVSSTLLELYSLQHNDGGWGWWPSDERSSPYITAYALWGLVSAKENGFPVSEDVMSRAVRYLRFDLSRSVHQKGSYMHDEAVFEAFVLSEYERVVGDEVNGLPGYAFALYKDRSILGLESKALLAMTLSNLGSPRDPITDLLNDIDGAAFISGSGISWQEKENDFGTMNTDTRTTAVILEAMLRLRPNDRTLPMVVRWLMTARNDGHWKTTQETAWSIIALSDWMKLSGELHPAYKASAKLNGDTWWEKEISEEDIRSTFTLRKSVKDLLEENIILLGREPDAVGRDRGMLYYTMALKTFARADKVKPANRGFFVSREYTLLSDPKKPISSARVGDIIDVKLTVVIPKDMHFVMLEDPIPAGTEPLNTRLETTTGLAPGVSEEGEGWWWMWAPEHVEMHDEKVSMFSSWLGSGSHEFHYQIRATIPGKYLVPPATASEMYFPDVFGRTGGLSFEVMP